MHSDHDYTCKYVIWNIINYSIATLGKLHEVFRHGDLHHQRCLGHLLLEANIWSFQDFHYLQQYAMGLLHPQWHLGLHLPVLHIIKLIIAGKTLKDNEHISQQIYPTILCIIPMKKQKQNTIIKRINIWTFSFDFVWLYGCMQIMVCIAVIKVYSTCLRFMCTFVIFPGINHIVQQGNRHRVTKRLSHGIQVTKMDQSKQAFPYSSN
jgi:hypothetical protein